MRSLPQTLAATYVRCRRSVADSGQIPKVQQLHEFQPLGTIPKLRTRVRFPSPAPGLISLPRLTKSLQSLLLAYATVRHCSLLFAASYCRSAVATAHLGQYNDARQPSQPTTLRSPLVNVSSDPIGIPRGAVCHKAVLQRHDRRDQFPSNGWQLAE